jgi:hypothetical protein
MATNPRIPYEPRKEPQLVPNRDPLKPKRPGGGMPGLIVGLAVALVLLAAIIYFLPRNPKNAPPPTNAQVPAQPVPGELQMQGMQLIAGSTDGAYYLDGSVTNTGPHSITGIVADVKLRDSQNRVVLDVQRPLEGMAAQNRELVSDPLTKDPIKPNDTRAVRLGLENVPASWNHNLPEIQIVTVTAVGR